MDIKKRRFWGFGSVSVPLCVSMPGNSVSSKIRHVNMPHLGWLAPLRRLPFGLDRNSEATYNVSALLG